MGGSVSKPAEKPYQNVLTQQNFAASEQEPGLRELLLLSNEIEDDLHFYNVYNCKDIVNKVTANRQDHALQQRVLAGTSCCTILAGRFLIILRSLADAYCSIVDKIASSHEFLQLDKKLRRGDVIRGSIAYHTELAQSFLANIKRCSALATIAHEIVTLDMLKILTPDLLNGVTYYRKFVQGRGLIRSDLVVLNDKNLQFNLHNFDTGLASMLLANSVTGAHLLKVTMIEDADSFFSSNSAESFIAKSMHVYDKNHSDSGVDLAKIYTEWQRASRRGYVEQWKNSERESKEHEEPVNKEVAVDDGCSAMNSSAFYNINVNNFAAQSQNTNENEIVDNTITVASADVNTSTQAAEKGLSLVPEVDINKALGSFGIPAVLESKEDGEAQVDVQSMIRRRVLALTAIIKTTASLLSKKNNDLNKDSLQRAQSLLTCSAYVLNMLLPVINEQKQETDKAGLLGKSAEVSPSWLMKTVSTQGSGWYILDIGLSEMFKKEGANQKEVKAILKLKK